MFSLCDQVRQNLKKKYGNQLPIHSYLNSLVIKEQKTGSSQTTIVLSSPSAFLKERAEKKLLPLIKKELFELLHPASFTIQSTIEGKPAAGKLPKKPLKAPSFSAPKRKPPKNPFNSFYTFENFISGPSNNMAVLACKNLAQKPLNNQYSNPLFLYGQTGLGKTHLLHALGQALFLKNPSFHIEYLSAEKFIYQYVHSLRKGAMDSFRSRYRDKTQIFLIDDIQAIEKGTASQEEFFHTFNSIYSRGGLIVCTCDRLPKEIKKMETRLQTRLSGGVVVHISPPDIETRIAILQKKAQQRKIQLSQEVLYFIARISESSIRELEGNLNKLKMACEISGQKPGLRFTEKLFSNEEQPQTSTIEGIQKRVANEFQISLAQMLSPNRSRRILQARQKAMSLVRQKLSHLTLTEIGGAFGGKSHSSVLYALKKQKSGEKCQKKPHF